jgi:23S rRNA (cytidine1920-2'-O)/16S rRNA (cytidine1409-2'-O)-methyltransferase
MKKERVDKLLLDQGKVSDLDEARRLVMAGKVRASRDHLVQKASETFSVETVLIVEQSQQYVSRGAYKLLGAIELHADDLTGLIAMDIGSSTGGFTDLMLQRGISKVYAIDSGRGQLHQKLRNDSRVISMEKTNARYLKRDQIQDHISIMTMDVSFISVKTLIPNLLPFLDKAARLFILIKPQFETEKRYLRKGVLIDADIRQQTVDHVVEFCKSLNLNVIDLIPSPIKGPKGNQEYLLVLSF